MRIKGKKGFSMIEMLIVIVIMGLLTAGAIPLYQSFLSQAREQVLSSQLLRAINLTRSEAIMRGTPITLCPGRDDAICSGSWNDGYSIFTADRRLLFKFQNDAEGDLHWRASLGRNEITFLSSGLVSIEDGTFWYCRSASVNPSWAIVVNKSGRARLMLPTKNGKILDDRGEPLGC